MEQPAQHGVPREPGGTGPGPSAARRAAFLCVPLLLAALLPVPGCGYTLEPLTPAGIRTVHVPLFGNETRRREMEFGLTEAVARELRRAGYRIAGPGSCDAVLRGKIVQVREEALALDAAGGVTEGRLTVTAEYVLERSGGGEAASGRVEEGGEVVFARGEDRPAGLDRALAEVARALVRGLEPPRK